MISVMPIGRHWHGLKARVTDAVAGHGGNPKFEIRTDSTELVEVKSKARIAKAPNAV